MSPEREKDLSKALDEMITEAETLYDTIGKNEPFVIVGLGQFLRIQTAKTMRAAGGEEVQKALVGMIGDVEATYRALDQVRRRKKRIVVSEAQISRLKAARSIAGISASEAPPHTV